MGHDTVTWRRLWSSTSDELGDRVAARWLCEHASGHEGHEFLGVLDSPATERGVAHLDAMISRARRGEPLQYVLGRWAFRHLDVMVDDRVLIPRPETERIVDIVADILATLTSAGPRWTIADLGTGSGVIGLALLSEMPIDSCEVWMTDVSPDAIDVARANAAGIGRSAVHARFAVGSWCEALPTDRRGTFDVLVSNPPYIAHDDDEIEASVRDWEPPAALFANDGGSAAIATIVEQSTDWLTPGGWLVMEMGHRQADLVRGLFIDGGFDEVRVHQDAAGRDRFVSGRH